MLSAAGIEDQASGQCAFYSEISMETVKIWGLLQLENQIRLTWVIRSSRLELINSLGWMGMNSDGAACKSLWGWFGWSESLSRVWESEQGLTLAGSDTALATALTAPTAPSAVAWVKGGWCWEQTQLIACPKPMGTWWLWNVPAIRTGWKWLVEQHTARGIWQAAQPHKHPLDGKCS